MRNLLALVALSELDDCDDYAVGILLPAPADGALPRMLPVQAVLIGDRIDG